MDNRKYAVSNIVLLGLVSMFIDMSTEMVYPLIPLYLTSALGAAPSVVGVIEGIAESLAAFLRVMSGYIGDVYRNKKRLTFIGYSAAVVYKLVLLASSSWLGVLAARVTDRVGKGIRTAPRDALVAQSSVKGKLGGSFGLHKMFDMAGSSAGVLLAFFFMSRGLDFRTAFLWSIVPALFGIAMITAVREERTEDAGTEKISFRDFKMSGKLKLYLGTVFIFCLGNSSNAFLLLKARESGFSDSGTILLYLIFNVSTSVLAIPAGKLSDKFGRSSALVPGYALYGLVYLGIASLSSAAMTVFLFVAYGAYNALISGAERAFIAEAAPLEFRGTALGIYGMLQGVGLLFSSMIAGALWVNINSDAPFLFGGALGIASAALVALILRMKAGPARRLTQGGA